jgi:hypothetical protein
MEWRPTYDEGFRDGENLVCVILVEVTLLFSTRLSVTSLVCILVEVRGHC